MSSFVADVVVSVAASAVGALGLAEGGLAATALTGAIEGGALGGVIGGLTGGTKGLVSGLEGGFLTGGLMGGISGALGSTAPVLDASGNVVTQGTGIFSPNASTGLTGTGGATGGTGLTGGSATTTFGADGTPSTTFGAGSSSGLQVSGAGGTNVANPWSLTGGTGVAAPGLTTVAADGTTITASGADTGATANAPQSLSQKLASFATPKNILSVGTDLYSIEQGKALQQQAAALAKQQDPFASQRAQYAAQLSALEANPSSLVSTPGYQAGIQSLQRSEAASGTLSSGNAQAELVNYGSNAYNQQVQTLASLAGAGATPGAGAATALAGSSMATKANVSAGLNLASLTGGSSNDTSYLAQLMQAKLLG